MKNILILFFAVVTVVSFVPVQKAEATWDIPEINICEIVPALCQVTPSIEPSVSPEPSGEPSVEPSAEPTTEVTTAPTAGPTTVPNENHGDGKSDGRSDGLCSKPPCVSGNVVPKGPPATGRGR